MDFDNAKPGLVIAFAVTLFGAAACDSVPQRAVGPGFGESIHRNMAVHIINPQPPAAAPTDLDGARGAIAIDRYKKDQVEPPEMPGTTTISGEGAGGAN